jgi:hypothetical protein
MMSVWRAAFAHSPPQQAIVGPARVGKIMLEPSALAFAETFFRLKR